MGLVEIVSVEVVKRLKIDQPRVRNAHNKDAGLIVLTE